MSGQSGNKVSQDWEAERDSPPQPLSPQSPSPAATTHLQPLVPERRPVYDASSSATSSMKPSVVSLPAGTPMPAPAENQLGPKGSDSKSCPSLPGSSSERSGCETPSPGVPSHPQRKGRGCCPATLGPLPLAKDLPFSPLPIPTTQGLGAEDTSRKGAAGGLGKGAGQKLDPRQPASPPPQGSAAAAGQGPGEARWMGKTAAPGGRWRARASVQPAGAASHPDLGWGHGVLGLTGPGGRQAHIFPPNSPQSLRVAVLVPSSDGVAGGPRAQPGQAHVITRAPRQPRGREGPPRLPLQAARPPRWVTEAPPTAQHPGRKSGAERRAPRARGQDELRPAAPARFLAQGPRRGSLVPRTTSCSRSRCQGLRGQMETSFFYCQV